jgi:hypothetical protein
MLSVSMNAIQTTTAELSVKITLRQQFEIKNECLGKLFTETRKLLKEEKFRVAIEIISKKMYTKDRFDSLTNTLFCMVGPEFRDTFMQMRSGEIPHLSKILSREAIEYIDEILVQALSIALWYATQENPTVKGFRQCLKKYM